MALSIRELTPHEQDRLVREDVIWLTTIRDDGQPMPTPVWFLWNGRDFLIYSQPNQRKIKNIQRHPLVSLNLNTNEAGDDVIIIMGEAEISPGTPSALDNQPYLEKYRSGIQAIQMTPESFSQDFSTAIRVRPVSIRHW